MTKRNGLKKDSRLQCPREKCGHILKPRKKDPLTGMPLIPLSCPRCKSYVKFIVINK